ncbi:hypothetical protein GLOIN_2v418363 [Rhizophagus irregularis DAOM 181602=DAOM 197198]|uniref:Uncharacterized protein n=1 Tax=Rhizophagus irregularis (strain DAOM 181602 / DAOM 197198 / MUCL 43194) TaxID=747089 RepID=A0A2P4PJP6_RHIID|nr:hypothetical protein GLOIN_2v418363 [Rhizophagus irregularis DAOM 181602=DAOM 197198]POG65600.1 hypothetical protein GLOIN_2v418363 [Rhizophagus irregularis DAOM 181602=DAOM 197198]GET58149.1 hypothetical protein GLOIN_2v418363 [Rhizophagus irregularis DAOM 181602=DAOM 197198]|eukprot:XP_025172466.1 hypothetical protein GLOIN_2v418363 [Rhizophagus irregularis DAOM 181602=DAOM 197198]
MIVKTLAQYILFWLDFTRQIRKIKLRKIGILIFIYYLFIIIDYIDNCDYGFVLILILLDLIFTEFAPYK